MDSARIKNIMNDLLFTFNSQQLTPSIQKSHQTKTAPSSAQQPAKFDLALRNIRTKRLKRYEKIFESEGMKKLTTEPQKLTLGPQSRASENLVRISDCSPITQFRSIQTIEDDPRLMRTRDIVTSGCFSSKTKKDHLARTPNLIENGTKTLENQTKQNEIIRKRRGLSLKEEPLVSYPSDQKKLPNVFRSKSISHGKQALPKARQLQQERDQKLKSRTPKAIKSLTKKIYYQGCQPLRSQRILPSLDGGEYQRVNDCLNDEELESPYTPAFTHS